MRNNLEMENLVKTIDQIGMKEMMCESITEKIRKLERECYAIYRYHTGIAKSCGRGYELEKMEALEYADSYKEEMSIYADFANLSKSRAESLKKTRLSLERKLEDMGGEL